MVKEQVLEVRGDFRPIGRPGLGTSLQGTKLIVVVSNLSPEEIAIVQVMNTVPCVEA